MFFLGHMAWGYVWAVVFAGRRGGKLFVPAVLMLSVLPDVDLFLGGFGVGHHTFFHSIFFWVVMFVPAFVIFRGKVVPYLAAVVQHFAFGDFVVGAVMLFWPFSLSYFGFSAAMMSVFDVALEIVGFLLAVGVMFFNGDLRRLLSVEKRNVLMVFPLLALVSSMLFFAVDVPVIPLVAHLLVSPVFAAIVLAHIVLVVFLAISTMQGLRKFRFRNF